MDNVGHENSSHSKLQGIKSGSLPLKEDFLPESLLSLTKHVFLLLNKVLLSNPAWVRCYESF